MNRKIALERELQAARRKYEEDVARLPALFEQLCACGSVEKASIPTKARSHREYKAYAGRLVHNLGCPDAGPDDLFCNVPYTPLE